MRSRSSASGWRRARLPQSEGHRNSAVKGPLVSCSPQCTWVGSCCFAAAALSNLGFWSSSSLLGWDKANAEGYRALICREPHGTAEETNGLLFARCTEWDAVAFIRLLVACFYQSFRSSSSTRPQPHATAQKETQAPPESLMAKGWRCCSGSNRRPGALPNGSN